MHKLYMEFCKRVYTDKERILGKVFMESKRTVISQNPSNDNLYGPAVLWTLFGDPGLRIRYPGGQTDICAKPQTGLRNKIALRIDVQEENSFHCHPSFQASLSHAKIT